MLSMNQIGGAAVRLYHHLAAPWGFWEIVLAAGIVFIGFGCHDGLHLDLLVPGALAYATAMWFGTPPKVTP